MTAGWRLKLTSWFFLLCAGILIYRLFYWQVLAGSRLAVLAQTQQQLTIEVPARRGEVLSADNSVLVTNQPAYFGYLIRGEEPFPADLTKTLAKIIST